jgi:hypothetical protein
MWRHPLDVFLDIVFSIDTKNITRRSAVMRERVGYATLRYQRSKKYAITWTE